MLKKLLCLVWLGFCFTGIINNWKKYGILDFIIVITVTILPFIIYKFISKHSHNKNNNQKEINNFDIDRTPSSPNNRNFTSQPAPTPAQNITSQPQTALPDQSTPTSNIPNKVPATYSESQAQDDLRILNDCTKLMQTTINFETFFSRYELAIQKSQILEQKGMNISSDMNLQAILQLKERNLERILQVTYDKEISAIKSIKTVKGKINRINKLLDMLSQYNDELEVANGYSTIVNSLKKLQKELKDEHKAVISEKYQVAYQTAVADAERIKSDFENSGTECYQILGEPDCKHYKICKQNNGKVYYLSEYQIGKTAPPFHEQCTCTVIPYFDDEF